MNRAIIVSAPSDTAELAEQTLKGLGFSFMAVVSGGSEARRLIKNGVAADVVVINTPLPDEFGQELAEYAALETDAGVILICLGDIAGEMAERLSGIGVVVLPKPVTRDQLAESIRRVTEDRSRFPEERESSEVLGRIDDIRLINRAKSVLMKYLRFTEPQAHRYLEKQAMNNRCTRRQAAERIVKTYNNFK